jgi:MSHA biogenesis protein MshN
MSVINQMLRDLDARQASEQERAGLPPRLRTLPASAATRKQSWRMLVLGMGIGALVAGIVASVVMTPAPVPEPAPVRLAPPPPPAIVPAVPAAVPPAPTFSPPQTEMSADTSEMKISTLLAQTRALPAEPPPAVPPVKEKAVPVPDKAVAEPARAIPTKPPAMPAQKAERIGVPPSGEVQIDKRSKGGTGREMAETEYRKGMQAVKRGDNAAAQPLLQHALELDPSLPKARQALLSVLVSGKRWQDAQQVAQDGLALDPKQSGWAIILARLQFEQGDMAAALETLGRHAPYAGGDADYQSLFAYLLQKQQRFPEAAERFHAALSLRPNEGRWWFGLGIALDASGKGAEAKDAYAKAREAGNLPADMAAIVEQKLK